MFASERRGESIANYSSHPIPNVVQLVGAANFSDMITPLGYAQNYGAIDRACSGLMPPHEYCHIAEEEERPKGKRKRLSDPSSPSHPSKTGEGDADTDLSGETSEADEKKQRISGRNQLRGKQVKEGCQGGGENNYIHVRARSGQATNSHSLAERVRREKISQRMRLLQELVPGCNKIAGKAVMLDEIINYVQSLQQQVEFLSMKLATLNPELNFDIDQI